MFQADNHTDNEGESPPVIGVENSSPVVKAFDSPMVGLASADNTPRGASANNTPRGGTASNVTDEESVSEWEIERQKVSLFGI